MPKISQLPQIGSVATSTDLLAIVHGGVTNKISLSDMLDSRKLWTCDSAGDEGGEIGLATPKTNTTLAGDTVSIDIYRNQFRVFERTSPHRGFFVNLTECANNANTNILNNGAEITLGDYAGSGTQWGSNQKLYAGGWAGQDTYFTAAYLGNGTYNRPWENPSASLHAGHSWASVELKGKYGAFVDFGTNNHNDMDGRIIYRPNTLSDGNLDTDRAEGFFKFYTDYHGPSDIETTTGVKAQTEYGSTCRLKLDKNGAYFSSDIVAFSHFSDERLKKDIKDLDGEECLSKIEQLQGVTYKWKDQEERGEQIGLVAQQVEPHVPQVVKEQGRLEKDDDGPLPKYKQVEYDKLVPLLIESVKQLSARVAELESKND